MLTITVLVQVRQYQVIEIYAIYMLSLFYQCALIFFKPYENPSENKLEIFNELGVSVVLVFYLLATDIAGNNETIKYYAGYGIVTNLIANMAVNFTIFFYKAYQIVKLRIVRWCRTFVT